MSKKKRTNPNKIPVAQKSVDISKIIDEESVGNMCRAWLLVLLTLVEQDGFEAEAIDEIWISANDYIDNGDLSGSDLTKEIKRISKLAGLETPFQNLHKVEVRTVGKLTALRRKLRENALCGGICVVLLGLEATKRFDEDALRRISLNAKLTLAEIENGVTSFEKIRESLCDAHIRVVESDESMELVPNDEG